MLVFYNEAGIIQIKPSSKKDRFKDRLLRYQLLCQLESTYLKVVVQ